MDTASTGSAGSSLGKLLPKSISVKRRRRKESNAVGDDEDGVRGRSAASSRNNSILDSDGTGSINMQDDDKRSLVSQYESDPEP